ncbi:hypothetical protein CEXT_441871 [Caerostris extrusa]|uniref:Uncharacterized protein n=1 Tax=Caerostris extrusa TaxID=172846 RepID=A0AAV4RHV6_CAEEX|nr:hypothetical protein CEXT_441871 [Caerostris extrusa]
MLLLKWLVRCKKKTREAVVKSKSERFTLIMREGTGWGKDSDSSRPVKLVSPDVFIPKGIAELKQSFTTPFAPE